MRQARAVPGDRVDFAICVACGEVTAAEKPASDGAFRAGEPPVRPARSASTAAEDDPKSKPTVAGCFLTFVCVAIIFGCGFPLITWRSPETGLQVPRMVAIAVPFLLAALCYAIGAAILKVLGIAIFAKPTRPTDGDAE